MVRLAGAADVAGIAAQMVESGLYAVDAASRIAAEQVRSPRAWLFVVTWRGEPLQYDTYRFARAERAVGAGLEERTTVREESGIITGGFNSHVDRERPHWFYREVGHPMLAALYRAGGRTMISPIRADRPAWVEYLRVTYGAVEIGRTSRAVRLRYDLAHAVKVFTGWPARRTAAPVTRGLLTVSACGVDEALALLPGLWVGASPERARLAERLLHERYWLDCGTLAVGTEAGVPKALWVTRDNSPLGGSQCAHATLSPWAAAPRLLHKLILEWELALGYTTASAVWEAWMWDLPRSRALVPWRERRRWVRWGHGGVVFVSTELTLADAVAIPDTSWA